MYAELCSYDNLLLAFQKARKGKTTRPDVVAFEQNLHENLLILRSELLFHTYTPRPQTTFIIRDPKTRKITKSDFRDRVVHHALCNIIEPIFEKAFIFDSYANRRRKGVLKALGRFSFFSRKASRNFSTACFVLKADIKHYFDTVSHEVLFSILKKKIPDKKVLWLIRRIIKSNGFKGKPTGMPLGNLTSQFFANVFLNELDQFVKHTIKAKYYLRYVDDFVVLHRSPVVLEEYKKRINTFLASSLSLQLHPDKTKIRKLSQGLTFLGCRVFTNHILLARKNIQHFNRKKQALFSAYELGLSTYDELYDVIEGWLAHVQHLNTYKLRKKIIQEWSFHFLHEISLKEIHRFLRRESSITSI